MIDYNHNRMKPLAAVLALVIAASGWFYMFYSRAAANLSGIEDSATNVKRQRLRQVGGFLMFLLAVGIFAGFYTFDPEASRGGFVLVWIGVIFLLLAICVLGLIDLRLTWRLRRRR